MEKIYSMKLHEIFKIQEYFYVTRVPGGWIYESTKSTGSFISSTFVPYDTEFLI